MRKRATVRRRVLRPKGHEIFTNKNSVLQKINTV